MNPALIVLKKMFICVSLFTEAIMRRNGHTVNPFAYTDLE